LPQKVATRSLLSIVKPTMSSLSPYADFTYASLSAVAIEHHPLINLHVASHRNMDHEYWAHASEVNAFLHFMGLAIFMHIARSE